MLVDHHHPGFVFRNQVAIMNLKAQMGAPRLDGSGAIGVSRWSLRRKTRFVRRIISGRCSLLSRMLGRFMLASRDCRRRPGAIEAVQFQRRTRRRFKPQL